MPVATLAKIEQSTIGKTIDATEPAQTSEAIQ
jgi:hypothetical protein